MVETMGQYDSEMLSIGVPEGDGVVIDRARAWELLYGDSDEAVVASVLPRLRPMRFSGALRADRVPAWHDTRRRTWSVRVIGRFHRNSKGRWRGGRASLSNGRPTIHRF